MFNKKGITLEALLTIVVVLSVALALSIPHWGRSKHTARAQKAASVIASIRAEQQNRCQSGKPYAGVFADLASQVPSAKDVKKPELTLGGFVYQLREQGLKASNEQHDFSLNILSYKDGPVCCSGSYCPDLTRRYPLCNDLSVEYAEACSAPICEVEPDNCACNPNQCKCPAYASMNCECSGTCFKECPLDTRPSLECNGCGGRSVTCNTQTGEWLAEPCSVASPDECQLCVDGQTQGAQPCNVCGRQSTRLCNNGQWVDSLGACSKTASQCLEQAEVPCVEGAVRGAQLCNGCGEQSTEKCVAGVWTAAPGLCNRTEAFCQTQTQACETDRNSCACIPTRAACCTSEQLTGGMEFIEREGACRCPEQAPVWLEGRCQPAAPQSNASAVTEPALP